MLKLLLHHCLYFLSVYDQVRQLKIVYQFLKKLKNLENLDINSHILSDSNVRFLSNEVKLLNLKFLKIRMPIKVSPFGNSSEMHELLS